MQVILLVFFAMAAFCVGGFLTYHMALISYGTTTYESARTKNAGLKSGQSDGQDRPLKGDTYRMSRYKQGVVENIFVILRPKESLRAACKDN